jgi:4-hydroxy-2-oxoheptanedioate aldolase
MQGLREIWDTGGTALGGWLTVTNTLTAEATARAGFDYVCIDTQHGAIDASDAVQMIQAVLLGGSRPIVRVPSSDPSHIGYALDAGAYGVIVPMVNTAEAAAAAVAAGRYAPHGSRSWGPSTAAMRVDGDYGDWSSANVTVIPMIETAEAVENLAAILAVDGVDAVYIGPADLSITLGLAPGNHDGAPAFDDAINAIITGCERAGVVPGIHASGTLAPTRRSMGFRMITVTTEMLALKAGLANELARASA